MHYLNHLGRDAKMLKALAEQSKELAPAALSAAWQDLIKAAVLNDIGPVIETAGLAHIRSYLESTRQPADFAEAVASQKAVHGEAFPALTDDDWQRFVQAIYRDEGGVPVADFDPALLNTVRAMDLDKPMPDLWLQFEALAAVPLLAIRGANSRLLSAQTLEEMGRRHPRLEAIPDATTCVSCS